MRMRYGSRHTSTKLSSADASNKGQDGAWRGQVSIADCGLRIADLLDDWQSAFRNPHSALLPGMILPLGVLLDVLTIEIHVSQVAGRVADRLIAEMRRRGVAAFAAGADGLRSHAIAEFDDR